MSYQTYEKICKWFGLVFWAGFFFFQGMYLLAIVHMFGLDMSHGPAPYIVVLGGAAAWFLLLVVATWSGAMAGQNDIRKIVERHAQQESKCLN